MEAACLVGAKAAAEATREAMMADFMVVVFDFLKDEIVRTVLNQARKKNSSSTLGRATWQRSNFKDVSSVNVGSVHIKYSRYSTIRIEEFA